MKGEGPFLGYGSPEALERAITQEESFDFQVVEGLCYATVCTSLSQDEAVARMKRRPSGTTGGWCLSDEAFADGHPNPCACDRLPDHTHYLFVC